MTRLKGVISVLTARLRRRRRRHSLEASTETWSRFPIRDGDYLSEW